MILASIDLEGTGLNINVCQILEVAVVLWDTTDFVTPVEELPTFQTYVLNDPIIGEPTGLAMNATIIDRIARRDPTFRYCRPNRIGSAIADFCRRNIPDEHESTKPYPVRIWPAGFNFDSCDRQFLIRLDSFKSWIELRHRSISPATLMFDPRFDSEIPGTEECYRRACIDPTKEERHTAVGDARGVIKVLRYAWRHED